MEASIFFSFGERNLLQNQNYFNCQVNLHIRGLCCGLWALSSGGAFHKDFSLYSRCGQTFSLGEPKLKLHRTKASTNCSVVKTQNGSLPWTLNLFFWVWSKWFSHVLVSGDSFCLILYFAVYLFPFASLGSRSTGILSSFNWLTSCIKCHSAHCAVIMKNNLLSGIVCIQRAFFLPHKISNSILFFFFARIIWPPNSNLWYPNLVSPAL